jgi:hypothetical protein
MGSVKSIEMFFNNAEDTLRRFGLTHLDWHIDSLFVHLKRDFFEDVLNVFPDFILKIETDLGFPEGTQAALQSTYERLCKNKTLFDNAISENASPKDKASILLRSLLNDLEQKRFYGHTSVDLLQKS